MRGKLKNCGGLWKTRKPTTLKGSLFIEELNKTIDVIAILKIDDQKRNSSDPDVVILREQDFPDIF